MGRARKYPAGLTAAEKKKLLSEVIEGKRGSYDQVVGKLPWIGLTRDLGRSALSEMLIKMVDRMYGMISKDDPRRELLNQGLWMSPDEEEPWEEVPNPEGYYRSSPFYREQRYFIGRPDDDMKGIVSPLSRATVKLMPVEPVDSELRDYDVLVNVGEDYGGRYNPYKRDFILQRFPMVNPMMASVDGDDYIVSSWFGKGGIMPDTDILKALKKGPGNG